MKKGLESGLGKDMRAALREASMSGGTGRNCPDDCPERGRCSKTPPWKCAWLRQNAIDMGADALTTATQRSAGEKFDDSAMADALKLLGVEPNEGQP